MAILESLLESERPTRERLEMIASELVDPSKQDVFNRSRYPSIVRGEDARLYKNEGALNYYSWRLVRTGPTQDWAVTIILTALITTLINLLFKWLSRIRWRNVERKKVAEQRKAEKKLKKLNKTKDM